MVIFLSIIGVLLLLYGILVLQIGSGTSFWIVWESMGLFAVLWAVLWHRGFLNSHKMFRNIVHTLFVLGMVSLFVLCALIATKFTSKGNAGLDYIIVLGAQVREDGPSIVLKYRLDAAIEYLNENTDTMCIVSGGQGKNEPVSEAEVMKNYLIDKGISQDRIILEDRSLNTAQNIRYSKAVMKKDYASVGIVTNDFHVFRAVSLAKKQELKGVCGIAADSNLLYLPNNVLRECFGILKDFIVRNIG